MTLMLGSQHSLVSALGLVFKADTGVGSALDNSAQFFSAEDLNGFLYLY